MLDLTTIRLARPDDATALAELHAEAWRYAYRGISPGVALERMIGRRGPIWWKSACDSSLGALALEFDGWIAGYTTFGRWRMRMRTDLPSGDIYELYLQPECHEAGFRRALFNEARRWLRERCPGELIVWALAENEPACVFYRAPGGRHGPAAERRRLSLAPAATIEWR